MTDTNDHIKVLRIFASLIKSNRIDRESANRHLDAIVEEIARLRKENERLRDGWQRYRTYWHEQKNETKRLREQVSYEKHGACPDCGWKSEAAITEDAAVEND